MKKIFLILCISFWSILSVGNVYAADSDNDGIIDPSDICANTPIGKSVDSSGIMIGCSIEQKYDLDNDSDDIFDSEDVCPFTIAFAVVDTSWTMIGCSQAQKQQDKDGDSIIDFIDTDNDNDLLLDTLENTGWSVIVPDVFGQTNPYILQVNSNYLDADTDDDGLNDLQEKNAFLNPRKADTDNDGVSDLSDTEITSKDRKNSVDATGKYTPSLLPGNTSDSDNDGILDLDDLCPGTPANTVVDETGSARGCSNLQKQINTDSDSLFDYQDNDIDGDGLTNVSETQGWLIEIPLTLSSPSTNPIIYTGSSDPYLIDSDNDGLWDAWERIAGLNPRDSDTDKDGVIDNIDTEITSEEGRKYVDTAWKYSPSIYWNADDDSDGIKNSGDICPWSPSGATVYTSGTYQWCTSQQKSFFLSDSDFDGISNTLDACPNTVYSQIWYVNSQGCVTTSSVITYLWGTTSYVGNANNISIWGSIWNESSNVKRNDKLLWFNENGQFIGVSQWWEEWFFNTLLRIARDIKNLFYIIASIYFLVITVRLVLANETEEELGNFKKWILWITIGIIVMQIAYAFTFLLYDQWVSAYLWASLLENLVWPLITLLQTLASFFFIAVAVYAFYRLVTANGNEEAVTTWKMTIVYALFGFLIIRFARAIVEAFYGKLSCDSFEMGFISVSGESCYAEFEITRWAQIIIDIINWFNGFVTIAVILMIIYAGFQIIFSLGDEEKISQGKKSLLYIAIWLLILVANYLILTFFLIPETTI